MTGVATSAGRRHRMVSRPLQAGEAIAQERNQSFVQKARQSTVLRSLHVMTADNFGRRLKTLSCLTPYEYVRKMWTSEPERFIINAAQPIKSRGLNNYGVSSVKP